MIVVRNAESKSSFLWKKLEVVDEGMSDGAG
jgi:hypothetical protein